MREAKYAAIKYIADPARNEPLNLGIIVWDEREFRVRVDEHAAARIVRENRHLPSDSFVRVGHILQEQVSAAWKNGEMSSFLDSHPGYPVLLTEERFTTILDEQSQTIDDTLGRLLHHVVQPKTGDSRVSPRTNALSQLTSSLKPLLKQALMYQSYSFPKSRSGRTRVADFYANSSTNVALDALHLDVTKANDILKRADAEAFKVEDILNSGSANGLRYWVYCHFPLGEEYESVANVVRTVLGSVNAEVYTDPVAVASKIMKSVLR